MRPGEEDNEVGGVVFLEEDIKAGVFPSAVKSTFVVFWAEMTSN